MAFELSHPTIEDIPEMTSVYVAAFSQDPDQSFIWNGIDPADKKDWLLHRFTKTFHQPENVFYKITEKSTGRMAAWARWHFPTVLTPQKAEERRIEEEKQANKTEEERRQDWPVGANVEMCATFFDSLDGMRKKYFDKEQMYGMCYIYLPT
jgi:hypothetical protein